MDNKQKRSIKRRLLALTGPVCQWCGGFFSADDLTLDHIIARSAGGSNRFTNMTLSCQPCNEKKANKPVHEFVAERKTSGARTDP